jgi:hypothetical protein
MTVVEMKRRWSVTSITLLLVASYSMASGAQDTASTKEAAKTGAVTGRVAYSDTKTPARLAQVMLLKVAPAKSQTEEKGATKVNLGLLGAGLNGLTQTGLDGRFEMPNVPVGEYIVLAQQNGAINPLSRMDLEELNGIKLGQITEAQIKDNLRNLTVVTVDAGKTADVAIGLTHGASISGILSYDDGSPAVGAQVHLLSKTKKGSFEEPNLSSMGGASGIGTILGNGTDDGGHFHIAGLAAGSYALRASLPLSALKNLGKNMKGMIAINTVSSDEDMVSSAALLANGLSVYNGNVFFKKDLKPIELGEGEQLTGADMTFPVDGMHSVQVHVEESATGHAVDVAQVLLLDADGKDALRLGYVDEQGDCTFDYVPEGNYTLRVVNAMDTSHVGKILSDDYDPKKAIHYGKAETKVQVSGDVSGIVLRVAKVATENKTGQ